MFSFSVSNLPFGNRFKSIAKGLFTTGLFPACLMLAALMVPAASASAHEYKLGSLTITHPWSRATPAGAKVAGGYLVIANHGQTDDRLIAVTAEVAGKPEIHEMAVKDNVMQMRMLENGIAIPAGGEVTLKPGSYHLMFMDLKRPIAEGETFKGTLTFEKAGKIDVIFNVEAMGAGKQHSDAPAGHDMHKQH